MNELTETAGAQPGSSDVRRVKIAVTAAGICSFALLYATQPLLPQLAAHFHLDAGEASLAVSVGTGALAISVLPIAVLSEVVGRRPVILASVFASAVLGLLLVLAPTFDVLIVLRALQGVAIAGFPGVASAYLVEQLGTKGVAAAVGAMIAGNTVGGMSGRLLSGFTTDWLGWHGALAAVGVLGLVCAVATAVTLPRARRTQHSASEGEAGGDGRGKLRELAAGVGLAVRTPVLLAQYGIALLAMGSFVALYNAAGFRLTGDPLHLSPAIASLVFLAYAMGSVTSVTVGRLVTRYGRRACQLVSLAVTAFGAALTLPDSLPVVIVGFVVLTGGFFATHSVANASVAAEAPVSARGPASGLYTLMYYLGSSIGGTLGAVVFSRAGWGWLIATVACWLALGVICSRLPRRRADRRPAAAATT